MILQKYINKMSAFIEIFNKISGIQAYYDYKETKSIKLESDSKYHKYSTITKDLQKALNEEIVEFGELKVDSLKKTIAIFLSFLKDIEQKNKKNYYEIVEACNLPATYINEIVQLNMNLTEITKTALTSTSLASLVISGVPTIIKSTVGAFASASTGTAISSLAGAAKTNAILAWLGGGSLASGGGGMVLGTTILTTTTITATGIVAIISAGLIASNIYAKKKTTVLNYAKEVEIACSQMEVSWTTMKGISERIKELSNITKEITQKSVSELYYLEPFIPDFDYRNQYHIKEFQKNLLLIKSISELSKTPLFDDDMNLSEQSEKIIIKTNKILNTEL